MEYQIKGMSSQLLVSDLERSIEFYTKKIRFEIEFRYEDFYAGIKKDAYSIHLKMSESSLHKTSNEDVKILFSVDAIDDLYKGFLDEAVTIKQPLRTMPYGKEFYVADPDGNVIAFVETT